MTKDLRRHIPNLLSTSRLLLAFVFPFLPAEARLGAIIWSLVSEFLDGFLARRWNVVTNLGQALDPIADKCFVIATVFVLLSEGILSWYHFVLVAMRDIIVAIGAFSILAESQVQAIRFLKPRFSGKVATAFQFMLLVALFAFEGGLNRPIVATIFILTAIMSSISAVDYLYAVLHRRFDQIEARAEELRQPASSKLV